MKEAISKVKHALATKDIIAHLTHYLVKDGFLYASDGRLTAVAPVADKRTYLVPGNEFQKAIELAPGEVTIEVSDGHVVVKSGRYRAKIQTLDPQSFTLPEKPPEWRAIPDLFLSALRAVRPFVSDNATQPWALTVGIDQGALYATNNITLVVSFVPGLEDVNILLPVWAVDYLLVRHEQLTAMNLNPNFAAFQWADGSWMRSQLVVGEFPSAAKTLIGSAAEPTWEITKELREAFNRAYALSESDVRIDVDRISGGHGKTAFVEEFELRVPAPNSGESIWHPKFLDLVLRAATHWAPDAYPRPAAFKGERVKGLIIGRT